MLLAPLLTALATLSLQASAQPAITDAPQDTAERADPPAAYHPAPSDSAKQPQAPRLELTHDARVVVIPVDDAIELGIAAFIRRVLDQHPKADAIVLDINTLGGRVDAAIQIRDALLKSKLPTVAFVDPRAISAGALIALATDLIAMTPGATMGAATPIRGDGAQQSEAVEEKMTSYMRTEMRATAEAKGRRGDLAEAMVDAEVEIPDVVQAGKLLTLDTARALKLGMAELKAESLEQLLSELGATEPKLVRTQVNWAEKIARIVTGPVLSGLLMSIGMLALLIALYTQNFGLPAIIGVFALATFFLGHLVVHLAGWEELLLFVGGLVLVALEALVIPGFGVAGILGLLALVASLVLALIGLDLEVSLNIGAVGHALARVFISIGLAIFGSALFLRFLPRTTFGKQLVLMGSTGVESGYIANTAAAQTLIGQTGPALTPLRPSGKARIDGLRREVLTEGDYVDTGDTVRVVRVQGSQIIVRKVAS